MTRQSWLFLFLLIASSASIISTYPRLNLTADENFHLRAGLEWWEQGTYTMHVLNPPLARVAIAAPIFFTHNEDITAHPASREEYIYTSSLMRLSILPFYILSCFIVFFWSRRLFGADSAVWSSALYMTVSSVAALAGLATTDMAYTAMYLLALFSAVEWLRQPGYAKAIFCGIAIGLMVGTKFSSLVHWPAALLFILAAQSWHNYQHAPHWSPLQRRHIASLVLIPLYIFFTLDVIYRFDLYALTQGLRALQHFQHRGFAIWMFGPLHNHGVWYFFPVVFLVKTPLPFHIANIIGNTRILRSWHEKDGAEKLYPLLAALGILISSLPSNIDVGVRHILPVYPLLAIPAGFGLYTLWQHARWPRAIATALLLWQIVPFILEYPDHLSFFNELAGAHPEHISLDSDFDWGQDIFLLDEAAQKRHIAKLYFCPRTLGSNHNAKQFARTQILECPVQRVDGWIAIGRTLRLNQNDNFAWLENTKAVQRIGRIYDLYYIPPLGKMRP